MPGKNDIRFQIIFKGKKLSLYEVAVRWYEAEDRKKTQQELGRKFDPLKAAPLPTKNLNYWEETLPSSPSYPSDIPQHNYSVREERGSNANITDYVQYCMHKSNMFSSVFQ